MTLHNKRLVLLLNLKEMSSLSSTGCLKEGKEAVQGVREIGVMVDLTPFVVCPDASLHAPFFYAPPVQKFCQLNALRQFSPGPAVSRFVPRPGGSIPGLEE